MSLRDDSKEHPYENRDPITRATGVSPDLLAHIRPLLDTNAKTLPLLLRAIAGGTNAREAGHDTVLILAAETIEFYERARRERRLV